jgi:hypothetical protein
MTARGIRNNNPGNLRPGKTPWRGQVGVDGGYCVFDTPENGLRALAMQLVIYQDKHGCRTVRDIITRWAPPEDNNDTEAYIAAVAAWLGVSDQQSIDLHDDLRLATLVSAIVQHENGSMPYTLAQVDGGVAEALA